MQHPFVLQQKGGKQPLVDLINKRKKAEAKQKAADDEDDDEDSDSEDEDEVFCKVAL